MEPTPIIADKTVKNENKKKEESIKEKKDDIKKDEEISEPNAVWSVWDVRPPYEIQDMKCTLKGYSIAALRTNFYIKELGVMLDAGLSSPNSIIEHMFITHGHADHMANVPFHLFSKRAGIPIQIYTPKEIVNPTKYFIESAYILSSEHDLESLGIKNEDLYIHGYYQLNGVSAGDSINLEIKNKNYRIDIIKCYHSVPCVGYGFTEKRKKLKEEYKNLSGKEIGELRKKGEDIYNEQEYPYFCFLGDTSKEILKEESIKKYKTIMIECTFILNDDLEQADKTFHIHWKHIEEYVKENQDKIFILYHFSQRYKKKELIEFFEQTKLTNIVPWIN